MSWLKKFFHRLTVRTLKVDILTLFISLITIAFGTVIFYSYTKNYYAILEYSKGRMERNSTAILSHIQDLAKEIESILEVTPGLFINSTNLTVTDPNLAQFMWHILKLNPNITAFFLVLGQGNAIVLSDVGQSAQTHYISKPSKAFPPDAAYILRINQKSNQAHPEIWIYKDKDFRTIGEESLTTPTYMVENQPWYTGVLEEQKLHWTDIYHLAGTHELGIAAADPIYKNGQLVAISGATLSFVALSKFIDAQKISAFGKVFIVNKQGDILAPLPDTLSSAKISRELVAAAFKQYKKNKNFNFSFKYHSVRYLVFLSDLSVNFSRGWMIMTVVPFTDFFFDLIKIQLEIALITLFILTICVFIVTIFSKRISRPIVALSKEVDKITNLNLHSDARIKSHIVEIRIMDTSIAAMRNALRSFSRYVPKDIVKQLLAQGKEIKLHVDKKQLTILFTDIKDFTTIAETHSLDILMPLLNEYFDGLSRIILNTQGTIDKYIGDSIMAFWGAPLDNASHAALSCKAALRCQAFLTQFNQRRREQGNPEFITRFGISSGMVVVGNIGTNERMNYTVIGDAVNAAARLQLTDKIYHVSVIISDEVYRQTGQQFLVRPLDIVEVKGKKSKIKIYELVALLEADPEIGATPEQIQLCQAFTAAYQKFTDGDYVMARSMFDEIHRQFPDDYPTVIYLDRLTPV